MTSDRDLVEAVKAGRPGAFERLVGSYQGLCWHIVLRIVRDPEDARELCQETFLRVHRNLHQYRFESALKTWIGRIAYSIALRHLERRKIPDTACIGGDEGETLLEREQGTDDVLVQVSADEVAAIVADRIALLPPVQRAVLTLYHLDELTIPEIARITDLPVGTVKSHLFRARNRLRTLVSARMGEMS